MGSPDRRSLTNYDLRSFINTQLILVLAKCFNFHAGKIDSPQSQWYSVTLGIVERPLFLI